MQNVFTMLRLYELHSKSEIIMIFILAEKVDFGRYDVILPRAMDKYSYFTNSGA